MANYLQISVFFRNFVPDFIILYMIGIIDNNTKFPHRLLGRVRNSLIINLMGGG